MLKFAMEALARYGLEGADVEFIRHNENITYRVIDPRSNRQLLLRIHRPAGAFSLELFGASRHTKEALCAEMQIVECLGRTTDIPVQEPVRSDSGELVTRLQDGTPVTLLTWVSGNTLSDVELSSVTLQRVGEAVAQLHRFSEDHPDRWRDQRYDYGEGMLPHIRARIFAARDVGALSLEQATAAEKAIQEIARRMRELNEMAGTRGLIHSDLSKSNLVLCERGIAPIDFCLCGYGHFAMDLGSLCSHFDSPGDRADILRGYARVHPGGIHPYFIEPFFAMQILLFIATHYGMAAQWNWFSGAMARWVNDAFEPLAAGRVFLMINREDGEKA